MANGKCGAHEVFRNGLRWCLEGPDVMRLMNIPFSLYWNEAEGYIKYNYDDTQDGYNPGDYVAGVVLPSTEEAESIIEELRALDGVVY